MIRNIVSIVALTMTISTLLYVAFQSNETIDLSKYSTNGLDLNYTVRIETDGNDNLSDSTNSTDYEFSPFLGKSFVGFKEALAFRVWG